MLFASGSVYDVTAATRVSAGDVSFAPGSLIGGFGGGLELTGGSLDLSSGAALSVAGFTQSGGLRVEDLKRDKSGQPQRVILSDGSNYSAEEFIAMIETGALRVRNAYLTGEPDALSIELINEAIPKPYEQSVKTLFSKAGPKIQRSLNRDSKAEE